VVVLLEQSDEYAIRVHFMSLVSLATSGENRPIRLPTALALA
jgi:hypothetical protein